MHHAVLVSGKQIDEGRRQHISKAQITAFLAYSAILLAASAVHTFWRDESEAWLIARTSSSISALLHNARYEGHPPLWYLILYLITRFTWNVEWMKLPNFLSAIVSVVLILRARSPHILIRLGLIFSYYMVFEYAVIARNYMVGIALLLGAVSLIKRESTASATTFVLLALAALTSLPALVLATSLFALCMYRIHIARKEADHFRTFAGPKHIRIAVAIFVASVLLAFVTMRPPADSAVLLDNYARAPGLVDRASLSGFWLGRGYFAIPAWRHDFWELREWSVLSSALTSALGYGALIGFTGYLHTRSIRWFYLGTTVCLLAQVITFASIAQRHLGWFFVVFMCALLLDDRDLMECSTVKTFLAKPLSGLLVAAMLVCQLASGAFALAVNFKRPFSTSKKVAAFLRQQHLDQATLVASPFYTSETVMAYLELPYAFDIQRHKNVPFVIWDRNEFLNRHSPPNPLVFHALEEQGQPTVLITEDPLAASDITKLNVSLLASFTGGVCSPDRYYIYGARNVPNSYRDHNLYEVTLPATR